MRFCKYLLLILVVASSIAISVFSYMNLTTKYKDYYSSLEEEPVMAPALKAAASGIYPWTEYTAPAVDADENKKEMTSSDEKDAVEKEEKSNNQEETQPETPAPKTFTQVDDEYFNDAVFIGDSRMLGLSMYCEALDSRATFFAKKSLSIYDIRDKEWVETEDNRKINVFDALSEMEFSKVYIMVGINELGRGTNEGYGAAYKEVIDRIRQINPDALIYINSIMHVSKEKSESDPVFNNGSINVRNMEVVPFADGQHVFFLNINDVLDDEEGNLQAELTGDGIHLKGSCYEPWHQYLLYNAIVD